MNFNDVFESLKPDLQEVDKIILGFAQGKSPLIAEISSHLVSSGGKRIRPVLLLLSAKICGYKNGINHHQLASAIELIHSATLLHDDVVDNSQIRRGKKTANALWDNKASILVGDYLFSIAFQLMAKSDDIKILSLLAKTSSIMADGEVMQLENSSDINLLQEKYFEIIFGKTAVLFSAACEVGALLAKVSSEQTFAMKEFGKNLGMIFQIVDDVLDYSGKSEVLGKRIGDDFFEGKITLPIIKLMQNVNESEASWIKDKFLQNLTDNLQNEEDFLEISGLLKKYNAIEMCKEEAWHYKNLALNNLQKFSDCYEKQALTIVLEHSLARIS